MASQAVRPAASRRGNQEASERCPWRPKTSEDAWTLTNPERLTRPWEQESMTEKRNNAAVSAAAARAALTALAPATGSGLLVDSNAERTTSFPAPRPNISALARELNLSRTTIRRKLAAGWKPPSIAVLPLEPAVATPIHPLSRGGRPFISAILVLTGLGIGTLAIGINLQQGMHLAASPAAAWTLAGLAVATDVLALTLPSAAAALWYARRPVLASTAWTTWTLAFGLAVLASLGFVERNVSDVAAGRQAIVATAASIAEQRQSAIEAARIAANAATEARKAECIVRGAKCREREADERTALQAVNSAIGVAVPAVAIIADADPQVTGALRLATWAGLPVRADDVTNLRLVLMVAVPNLAGLVLAFGLALRRSRQ